MSGVTESSGSPVGNIESLNFNPLHTVVGSNNELRDAITAPDSEGLFAEVRQDNFYFTAIIGIYGAWALRIPIPCLMASPLRGRTCPSSP